MTLEPGNGNLTKLEALRQDNQDERFARIEARLDKRDAFGSKIIDGAITAVIAAAVAYFVAQGLPPP